MCERLPYTFTPPLSPTTTLKAGVIISTFSWEPRFREAMEWGRDSAPRLTPSPMSFLLPRRYSVNGNFSSKRSLKAGGREGGQLGSRGLGGGDRLSNGLWKAPGLCGDVLAKERCVFKPMSLIPAKVNPRTICSGKLHPANSTA